MQNTYEGNFIVVLKDITINFSKLKASFLDVIYQ